MPLRTKKTGHFNPALFRFLRDLAAHNDRAWFAENKARYERDVRDPLLAFIVDFGPRLEKVSAHFVADPRPNGGSLFRIYRDTRFSKDKTPYKTHAAAQFRHARARDVHAPGYYLHLEPGEVFVGFGLWHPEPEPLEKVRASIVKSGASWTKVTSKKALGALEMQGDKLKRPPKGVAPDHPLIEELKRKDFIAVAQLSERDALAPDFIDTFTDLAKQGSGMMSFLTKAVGLPF